MHEALTSERNEVGLGRAPRAEGFGPLRRAAEVRRGHAGADRRAVDHPGRQRREPGAGDGEHRLVEPLQTLPALSRGRSRPHRCTSAPRREAHGRWCGDRPRPSPHPATVPSRGRPAAAPGGCRRSVRSTDRGRRRARWLPGARLGPASRRRGRSRRAGTGRCPATLRTSPRLRPGRRPRAGRACASHARSLASSSPTR